jgi:hypothetical protein
MPIYLRKTTTLALLLSLGTLVYLLRPYYYNYNPWAKPYLGENDPSKLYDHAIFRPGVAKPPTEPYSRVLVMGHLQSEDVSWVSRELPEFETKLYVVDDNSSTTRPMGISSDLPANKGHEAMIYLTYIITHYTALPDIVLFFHPHPGTWHNNILLHMDTAQTIRRINPAHVVRQGYFNTRCHLDPGCPDWLHIDRPRWQWDRVKKPEEPILTSKVFHDLHGPDTPRPKAISQPCCAQFAVSRERILQRPLEFYKRYRDWLLSTDLEDSESGRMLEYSRQYIFTGNFEFCPSMYKCYCDGYGVCFEGGEDALQQWMGILHQREKIARKENDMVEKGKGKGMKYQNLMKERLELEGLMENLREAAIKRGADPKTRAEDCGREWKEGDGF